MRVYGEGLYRGQTNQLNQFIVDTRDAGKIYSYRLFLNEVVYNFKKGGSLKVYDRLSDQDSQHLTEVSFVLLIKSSANYPGSNSLSCAHTAC